MGTTWNNDISTISKCNDKLYHKLRDNCHIKVSLQEDMQLQKMYDPAAHKEEVQNKIRNNCKMDSWKIQVAWIGTEEIT
jgi:uncharacterized protein YecT (DUF1311 family)